MCRYRFLILFVFVFSFWRKTEGQENLQHFFRHISSAEGLLGKQVFAISQDGQGFMWIATDNGLQRYDGSRFVYYAEMLSDPSTGFTSAANIYAEPSKNLLWILKNRVVEKIELANKRFTVYTEDKLLADTSFIFNSYKDANNELWLLGNNAVYRYDKATKRNVLFCLSPVQTNSKQASFISSENNGNYTWLVRNSQLHLFDKKNKALYSNTYNPEHHPLLASRIAEASKAYTRFVMVDSKQNIWISTWGNFFFKYDRLKKDIHTYSLSSIKSKEDGRNSPDVGLLINCIMEDNHHKIWVGTENAGLLLYNEEKDNFDYDIMEERNAGGIQYNYKIYSLFQDREENIWIGTDQGMNIFNPYIQYFRSIRHLENKLSNSIPKNEIISSIQTPNGDIYLGTWGGGMTVYDSNFHFKKNILYKVPPENNFVWSFLQFDKEYLWIGCQHGYLMYYNTVTGSIQNQQPPELEKSTIRCMAKDKYDNIYFGLHNGKIVKWDAQKHAFISSSDSTRIHAGITNIFIDKTEQCWVSTELGFEKYDLQRMKFIQIWLPGKNSKSFSGITAKGVEELNDSVLIIGSVYGGLNFFNKRTETFSNLTVADGLPSNHIYAIKKDTNDFIWVTADYGLYKFRMGANEIIPYNIEPGIINSSFQSTAFYPLQDGQWLTFTTTEAISFFPYTPNNQIPGQTKTEITGFKLFEKALPIDSLLYYHRPIRLSYKENFFTVEFASMHFSSPQLTNYYYRLVGVNKDWVSGGTNRFAVYTDLQPGEYTFNVKAENGSSIGEITSLKIVISPPFWKTAWFISLVTVSIFFLIYKFVRWREQNMHAIAIEKLKVQQLNAEQYKSKLEMEQIINYFSFSLINKNSVDDVLWDVAKNLIGRLGFEDCMMYLWNEDKTKMIQKAGFGPKGSIEEINERPFDVIPGQGVVGFVMKMKEPVLIADTSKDIRYRPDEMVRLSEIAVPVIYNNELIGVIDSEHQEKNFFTVQHLQILNTISTLMANKIKSIESEQSLQQVHIEMYSINEQLSNAKLEALRSQMNPHFIFNCINSIDALIQGNDKYYATVYLNKFAKLIRNILDSSKQNVVPLYKDVDTLKLYIELEQLRTENKFTSEIRAEDQLLNYDYKVPPLIIQPYVENAILHGLRNRLDNDGKLTVSISRQNGHLVYVVEDNGVGRSAPRNSLKKENQSYGLQITSDRVKLFNNEENASVEITDLMENGKPAGTRVRVSLKIE